MKAKFFLRLALLIMSCYAWGFENFKQGAQYHLLKGVPSQQSVEVHYFFSFNCPACHKIALPMDAYLNKIEKEVSVFRHPLVMNQTTFQLARAYYVLGSARQLPGAMNVFYENAGRADLNDKVIVEKFTKLGCYDFKERWDALSASQLREICVKSSELASHFRLSFIPIVIVTGPQGTFSIYPSDNLPGSQIPACLSYVLLLQTKNTL